MIIIVNNIAIVILFRSRFTNLLTSSYLLKNVVTNVCVVVQFCFRFNLDFPLFFSMLIYDNEYQTKENPN